MRWNRPLHEACRCESSQDGPVYAYEVDGYGNFYCMDDGNVPSLLSLPYLGAVQTNEAIYQSTRRMLLSDKNPYYCQGDAWRTVPAGRTPGVDMIWPLGIIMQGLTSTSDRKSGNV